MRASHLSTALFILALTSLGKAQSVFQLEPKDPFQFKDSRRELWRDSSALRTILEVSGEENTIYLFPAMEYLYGSDNQKGSFQRWGVGGQMAYNPGKWKMGLTYFYNRGEYMSYRQEFINQQGLVPAFGEKSGRDKISSQYWDGFINYSPNDIFDFEAGYGRKFIGEGHRSLLLSDLAAPYPYLKIQTSFWKLTYTNLFSRQESAQGVMGNSSLYRRKYTASHFLNLRLFEKLDIGLFETVIWQSDEGSYRRGFDPNYLNPVIFYRPVEFSIGSSDNVIIGANIVYEAFPNHRFYFQALLDEFLLSEIRADVKQQLDPDRDIQSGWWGNKYGIQAGWKAKDLFALEGLSARLEYNLVRPYTYAHSNPTQAYSHLGLPLAHPLGANFEELVSMIEYNKPQWGLHLQYNQSQKGISPAGQNLGENIAASNAFRGREYENFTTQGEVQLQRYFEGSVSRRIGFLWSGELSLGFVWRQINFENGEDVNRMLYISFRSNLFDQSFDY